MAFEKAGRSVAFESRHSRNPQHQIFGLKADVRLKSALKSSTEASSHFRTVTPSHIRIIRSVTTLRCCPVDVLAWVFDIAGLTVHAVLEVDLKLPFRAFTHKIINPSRALARRRSGEFFPVHLHGNVRVAKVQVGRLAFLVVGERKADVRQTIE